jgi:hypothetical protein
MFYYQQQRQGQAKIAVAQEVGLHFKTPLSFELVSCLCVTEPLNIVVHCVLEMHCFGTDVWRSSQSNLTLLCGSLHQLD